MKKIYLNDINNNNNNKINKIEKTDLIAKGFSWVIVWDFALYWFM